MLGSSLASFSVPRLVGLVVDAITKEDWDKIDEMCLGMMAIVVFSAFCMLPRVYIFQTIGQRISWWLRYDLFLHLINKDVGFFDGQKVGNLLSRIASDTMIIQDALSTNIGMLCAALVFIIATIVVLGLISWRLTIVTFAGILPVCVFAICWGGCIRRLAKQRQGAKARIG